ncbi:MAG: hypothetical protein IJ068_02630 [Bacilli bacterium]|nr:hypothetical protein [Bacilli bacterium]
MISIDVNESKRIIGGGSTISGTFLNYLKGVLNVFFEIGQAVGGAIRRISSNSLCGF